MQARVPPKIWKDTVLFPFGSTEELKNEPRQLYDYSDLVSLCLTCLICAAVFLPDEHVVEIQQL